jgi:cysteine desulfurase
LVLFLETEHDSVRKVAERYGGEVVRVLPSGVIDLNDLKSKITDETQLISVSLANNELGTIQPLAEISGIIREIKIDRLKRGIKTQLLLHSDASQALNLLDINVARLGVDLLTLNSAKVYGPKGVGALYVSHDARLRPLTYGGGQENGLRSGTENVPGVIGFAKAVEQAKEHLNGNRKKYAAWRKVLLSELQGYELINKKHSLDNFVVLCYNGIDAERLVFLLEEKGVYVSTGAACAASKGVKSHVLKAIGLSDAEIAGSLRLTLGETNDETQIHEAAKIINEVVASEKERVNG